MKIEQTIKNAIEGGWLAGFKSPSGKKLSEGKDFEIVLKNDGFYLCRGKIMEDTMWRGKVIPAGTSYTWNQYLGRLEKTLLDPSFWQALFGKETACDSCGNEDCWQGILYCDDYKTAGTIEKWLYHATYYFKDYAMQGKSAEEFFEKLWTTDENKECTGPHEWDVIDFSHSTGGQVEEYCVKCDRSKKQIVENLSTEESRMERSDEVSRENAEAVN